MMESFNFIQTLPTLACVKDINSNYVNISKNLANLLGWKSPEECYGKTDHDLPCKASEFAEDFRKTDKKIITLEEKLVAACIASYSTGFEILLSEINPIKNIDGKVNGLFFHSINVSDIAQFRVLLNLQSLDRKLAGKSLTSTYILNTAYCPLSLTEKQATCLFLLVRGKTVKQIGKMLQISSRTVECHLEAIKLKLCCHSKSDIIEQAFLSGFLYYIPPYFQQQGLWNAMAVCT